MVAGGFLSGVAVSCSASWTPRDGQKRWIGWLRNGIVYDSAVQSASVILDSDHARSNCLAATLVAQIGEFR